MDLIVHNPSGASIERFRAWIAYDPSVLAGDSVTISKIFPTPMPGEADISASDGYVKVSGTSSAPQNGASIVVARIQMHVLKASAAASPMTFYDVTGTQISKTGIFVYDGTQETDVAATTQGILSVQFAQGSAASSASSAATTSAAASSAVSQNSAASLSSQMTQSSVSSETFQSSRSSQMMQSSAASSAASSAGVMPSAFNQLQVQKLLVTTDGSSAFLAWQKLPSSELVGYNLYYGTISGNYIQKKSMDATTMNITIRNLPVGTQYYFAVRGVNAQNIETDFSQEVAVVIGSPATSTAPLTGTVKGAAPSTPKTGGNISGSTGTPSVLILFLVISAVVGTGIALRRQLTAVSHP
jgi:hypothetical protein